jgi:AraC family transcriptional regulator, regulatory protein of adaptative response / DNA-3-methyladenine glycosylase II
MTSTVTPTALNTASCEQARLARDARFDGRFFTAVKSTGIYCRPVCPAPPPHARNVEYFATAAAAFSAGYRPCLRCRPESAPESPAWLGTETSVRRAVRLINEGALEVADLGALCTRLGLTPRHLRRLFQQHLGVSPGAYIQNRNLLFAKKLLSETSLPLLDVALASGFQSRRRFNAAFKEYLQLTPTQIRKSGTLPEQAGTCSLRLTFRPPYAWDVILNFYRQRCIAGVEVVSDTSYARSFMLGQHSGYYEVQLADEQQALEVNINYPDPGQLQNIVTMLRQQFDLNANPDLIAARLGTHPVLAKIQKQIPGLRIPGIISEFEALIRAVAGQQVSVKAARTLLQRLCERCNVLISHGNTDIRLLFPSPEIIVNTNLDNLGFTGKRISAMKQIAERYAAGFSARTGELQSSIELLTTLPGIGLWSAHYIAMRAFGEPDAFPAADLGILNALKNPARPTPRVVEELSQAWRPWRAYATLYLWHTL